MREYSSEYEPEAQKRKRGASAVHEDGLLLANMMHVLASLFVWPTAQPVSARGNAPGIYGQGRRD
jgi:hypothetical protein